MKHWGYEMKSSETRIDVRYVETDQMGVVHHSNYLVWFELGRTEFIKEMGFNYADMEKQGVLSPVTDINISYKRPMIYGQTAIVKTWVEQYTGIRVIYGYEIYNENKEICVIGNSTHTCVKKENFKPIALKKRFPEWHTAYEKAVK
jgi:acyl-CoA thioester hydrolase